MNTSYTFLYYKASGMSNFAKLVDITDYPDFLPDPERRDVSDLSTNHEKFEKGVYRLPEMSFGCFYSLAAFDKIADLQGTNTQYQIRFGENGEYGCWQWEGDVFVKPTGGGFGDSRRMQVTFYPNTMFTKIDPTVVYITPIGDKTVTGTGSIEVNVVTVPDDATLTVQSSATEKATASVSGKKVTVTGVAAGTSVITITAAKAGMTSGTETFTVTVV